MGTAASKEEGGPHSIGSSSRKKSSVYGWISEARSISPQEIQQARRDICKDVGAIVTPTQFSWNAVVPFGSRSLGLLQTDENLSVVAASHHGEGKLIVFGHDSFLTTLFIDESTYLNIQGHRRLTGLGTGRGTDGSGHLQPNNKQLIKNCLDWLGTNSTRNLIAHAPIAPLISHNLESMGYTVASFHSFATMDPSQYCCVIVKPSRIVDQSERDSLRLYVATGGSILAFDSLPIQDNIAGDIAGEFPTNRLLAPMGIVIAQRHLTLDDFSQNNSEETSQNPQDMRDTPHSKLSSAAPRLIAGERKSSLETSTSSFTLLRIKDNEEILDFSTVTAELHNAYKKPDQAISVTRCKALIDIITLTVNSVPAKILKKMLPPCPISYNLVNADIKVCEAAPITAEDTQTRALFALIHFKRKQNSSLEVPIAPDHVTFPGDMLLTAEQEEKAENVKGPQQPDPGSVSEDKDGVSEDQQDDIVKLLPQRGWQSTGLYVPAGKNVFVSVSTENSNAESTSAESAVLAQVGTHTDVLWNLGPTLKLVHSWRKHAKPKYRKRESWKRFPEIVTRHVIDQFSPFTIVNNSHGGILYLISRQSKTSPLPGPNSTVSDSHGAGGINSAIGGPAVVQNGYPVLDRSSVVPPSTLCTLVASGTPTIGADFANSSEFCLPSEQNGGGIDVINVIIQDHSSTEATVKNEIGPILRTQNSFSLDNSSRKSSVVLHSKQAQLSPNQLEVPPGEMNRKGSISLGSQRRSGVSTTAKDINRVLSSKFEGRTVDPVLKRCKVSGAIKMPLYELGTTSGDEWLEKIRFEKAPWAELVSPYAILTVPSRAVRNLRDPHNILSFWNGVVRQCADFTKVKTILPIRIAADVQLSSGYMHHGYPIMIHLDSVPGILHFSKLDTTGHYDMFHQLGHTFQNLHYSFEGFEEAVCALPGLYLLENHILTSPNCIFSLEDLYRAYNPSYSDWESQGLEHLLLNNASSIERDPNCFNVSCKESQNSIAGAIFQNNSTYLHCHMGKVNIMDLNSVEAYHDLGIVNTFMFLFLKKEFGWGLFVKLNNEYSLLRKSDYPKKDSQRVDMFCTYASLISSCNLEPYMRLWGLSVSDHVAKRTASLAKWLPSGIRIKFNQEVQPIALLVPEEITVAQS